MAPVSPTAGVRILQHAAAALGSVIRVHERDYESSTLLRAVVYYRRGDPVVTAVMREPNDVYTVLLKKGDSDPIRLWGWSTVDEAYSVCPDLTEVRYTLHVCFTEEDAYIKGIPWHELNGMIHAYHKDLAALQDSERALADLLYAV